jgi:hypothetical protein
MNRRQVLEDVAAGRLAPAAAARLLEAPAGGARTLRLRSTHQPVDVVADPRVAEVLVVDGTCDLQREGDVLVLDGAAAAGSRFGTWQGARRLAVRVNPQLDIDAEVTGAGLSVWGTSGALRAVVQAGSARLERLPGALDLRLTSGSAVVTGAPRAGDWRVRVESASLELVLDADADATVAVTGRYSRVDVLGSDGPLVLGSGARALDVEAAFSAVIVRTA